MVRDPTTKMNELRVYSKKKKKTQFTTVWHVVLFLFFLSVTNMLQIRLYRARFVNFVGTDVKKVFGRIRILFSMGHKIRFHLRVMRTDLREAPGGVAIFRYPLESIFLVPVENREKTILYKILIIFSNFSESFLTN